MTFAEVAIPVPFFPLDRVFDYAIPEGQTLREGQLVRLSFGRQKTWGVIWKIKDHSAYANEKIRPIDDVFLETPVFDQHGREFLEWLSNYYLYPLGEVLESALPGAVKETSAARMHKVQESLEQAPFPIHIAPSAVELNAEQRAALQKIQNDPKPHLLWGLTGSGKTEIYLHLVAQALEEGQGAMVLVPEIALTPQLMERFQSRFPNQVAVFHSGLKTTEVRNAWLDVLLGRRHIALGPRSALFAPLKNLGVIVVDEEHDGSYKQDDRLRYHARDAALVLGKLRGARVVLGSATPSAETLHEVHAGKLGIAKLYQRAVALAALPETIVADLKKDVAIENKNPLALVEATLQSEAESVSAEAQPIFFSAVLKNELESCLARSEQAILFLNRRGMASQYLCRSCGATAMCPDCDVTLTVHRGQLKCHYCDYTEAKANHCKSCQSEGNMTELGFGTQTLEAHVKIEFPRARVLRLDQDITEKKGMMEEVLGQFRRHEADILIGTQMVAKGHDFPRVSLVGIMLAEKGLGVPDFRAQERIYQLLLQVSGRAGRADRPGKVVFQSFQPESPLMQSIIHYRSLDDYGAYIDKEIVSRGEHLYPPIGKLVLFRVDGNDESQVVEALRAIRHALDRLPQKGQVILGPAPAPIARIKGRYRWNLLIKAPNREILHHAAHWIVRVWHEKKLERKFHSRLIVDFDPHQL